MNAASLIIAVLVSGVIAADAQDAKSPYAGQESRSIKSLSPEEVRGLLDGGGMGFAKAAELNGYPGPKHVIEVAERLQLTPAQLTATETIFSEMRARAQAIGARIVKHEQALNALFASKSVTSKSLAKSVDEIGVLQGELRAVHLEAHLAQADILTAQQTALYRELRGYGSSNATRDRAHSH